MEKEIKKSKKEIEGAISEFEKGKLTLKELKTVMGGDTTSTSTLFLRKVDVI
ncbi:hypothetical protein FLACOL_00216 [Flavobacterium columnare]|uniref:Bacteriocin-type signal sequence-containing protein n=2 Tax=Flavobacterium TaxID=237 RepID=A0ABW8PQ96_9FLAO|nr:hypothetical protein [Flavobacterium columnare]SPE76238.1 hypothetical protein FLACOL_00216 [Flavobacterium columnare]